MLKNLAILFVTVLLVAACIVAGASAKKSGEPVSLNAADTVSQDGVTYDFLLDRRGCHQSGCRSGNYRCAFWANWINRQVDLTSQRPWSPKVRPKHSR